MEVYFYTNYPLFSNALVVVKFILDSLIVQQPSLLHKKGMKFLENDWVGGWSKKVLAMEGFSESMGDFDFEIVGGGNWFLVFFLLF